MNFTLHQLKVFVTIDRCKSVTRAAEELHLTQPAVSIQLKRLQEQFEIPLTEVVGRQLYITDFGQEIVRVAQNILAEADTIRSTVQRHRGVLTGRIRISVVSTGKYVMPYFLKYFMREHPGVEMLIDVSNKNSVLRGLENNESDFSLVSVLPDHLALNHVSLMEDRLYLVGSSEFPKRNIALEELSDLTLIFRERGSATRGVMEAFLNRNNVMATKSMEMVSNEAVKQAVNAGLGYSIMPLIGLTNELSLGSLQVFPVKGLPIVNNWNLVYNKGKRLSPAAEELLRSISLHRNRVISKYFNFDDLLSEN